MADLRSHFLFLVSCFLLLFVRLSGGRESDYVNHIAACIAANDFACYWCNVCGVAMHAPKWREVDDENLCFVLVPAEFYPACVLRIGVAVMSSVTVGAKWCFCLKIFFFFLVSWYRRITFVVFFLEVFLGNVVLTWNMSVPLENEILCDLMGS